ncbi:hypothetical protein C8R45DRAFT_1185518 [Mycena sanguinolenta]|nr:hypothetical protein C8R45DRAFT_1185518 [Mycena sanguinolenta]
MILKTGTSAKQFLGASECVRLGLPALTPNLSWAISYSVENFPNILKLADGLKSIGTKYGGATAGPVALAFKAMISFLFLGPKRSSAISEPNATDVHSREVAFALRRRPIQIHPHPRHLDVRSTCLREDLVLLVHQRLPGSRPSTIPTAAGGSVVGHHTDRMALNDDKRSKVDVSLHRVSDPGPRLDTAGCMPSSRTTHSTRFTMAASLSSSSTSPSPSAAACARSVKAGWDSPRLDARGATPSKRTTGPHAAATRAIPLDRLPIARCLPIRIRIAILVRSHRPTQLEVWHPSSSHHSPLLRLNRAVPHIPIAIRARPPSDVRYPPEVRHPSNLAISASRIPIRAHSPSSSSPLAPPPHPRLDVPFVVIPCGEMPSLYSETSSSRGGGCAVKPERCTRHSVPATRRLLFHAGRRRDGLRERAEM